MRSSASGVRRKDAGNLVSDDKQTVSAEDEIVAIQSADPKIVYVPRYDPEVVVLPAPVPPISYYPTPYPWYYYPWGVGAAVWTSSVFFGATTAWAMGWAHHAIWHDVDIGDIGDIDFDRDFDRDIDRDFDRDIDRGNVDNRAQNKGRGDNRPGGGEGARGARASQLPASRPGGGNTWRPGGGGSAANRPSQLPEHATEHATRRCRLSPVDAPSRARRAAPGAAGAGRPSTLPCRWRRAQRAGGGAGSRLEQRGLAGGGPRPSTRPAGGQGSAARARGLPAGSAGATDRRPASARRPSTRPAGGGSRSGQLRRLRLVVARHGLRTARAGKLEPERELRQARSGSARGAVATAEAAEEGGYNRGGGGAGLQPRWRRI